MLKLLTCLRCGRVQKYSSDVRDLDNLRCWNQGCHGMMYHGLGYRLAAWQLNSGLARVPALGVIPKAVLYKRMMRGATC